MAFFDWFPVPRYLMLVSSEPNARFVNAILPDEKAYLFTATIDKVSREGLYDAIAFIIEENVPVSLKESVFSYEIVEEDAEKIKVAVTVAPKAVIDDQIKLFEQSGITVVSFDTESQTIARAVVLKGDNRAQLIINLGLKKVGFYIVEREVVQFSTTLGLVDSNDLRQSSEIKAKVEEVLTFWKTPVEEIILYGSSPYKDALAKALESDKNIKYV